MPARLTGGPPTPRILWFEVNQPAYTVDDRVSVRWWVENAERISLTIPNGRVLTQSAHDAPAGVSFPADETGVAQLVAEGAGGSVTSQPLLVWVVPIMPARAVLPPLPRIRVFLPMSISEAASAAVGVAQFPTERMSSIEVLRGATGRVLSVTDAFESEVIPKQRWRLHWLHFTLERVRRAVRDLPLPDWRKRP